MDNNVVSQSYKECYVAFLDILGFKNYVDTNSYDDVYRTLSNLETEAVANPNGAKMIYGIDIRDIKILCISDSVIISIEKSIPHSFEAIVWLCGAFQLALLLNAQLLMRGAISCGKFYMGNSEKTGQPILFGAAYNKAVELEKEAKYPRIIMDENTDMNLDESPLLQKDNDGKIYVNYMYRAEKAGAFSFKFPRVAKKIVDQMEKCDAVKGKYAWTKEYIIKSFDDESIFSAEYIAQCEKKPQRINLQLKFVSEENQQ